MEYFCGLGHGFDDCFVCIITLVLVICCVLFFIQLIFREKICVEAHFIQTLSWNVFQHERQQMTISSFHLCRLKTSAIIVHLVLWSHGYTV